MFQSTHSLRSATASSKRQGAGVGVSIHALLAECDPTTHTPPERGKGFNPRTPCGVRQLAKHFTAVVSQFQSTHSLRSATCFRFPGGVDNGSFNPRTPCGVRPARLRPCLISVPFQSTHSLRSATEEDEEELLELLVSIHALLAECDGLPGDEPVGNQGFNPRTPCGVRPLMEGTFTALPSFNPRTPCGVRP